MVNRHARRATPAVRCAGLLLALGAVSVRPGRWILVATTGTNWGCFIVTVN